MRLPLKPAAIIAVPRPLISSCASLYFMGRYSPPFLSFTQNAVFSANSAQEVSIIFFISVMGLEFLYFTVGSLLFLISLTNFSAHSLSFAFRTIYPESCAISVLLFLFAICPDFSRFSPASSDFVLLFSSSSFQILHPLPQLSSRAYKLAVHRIPRIPHAL